MFTSRFLAPISAAGLLVLPPSLLAGTLQEDFATDPAAHGWRVAGNTRLFSWDATNQNLRVTWDSSQPNSYFYRPLGTILTRNDDFSLGFDLRLDDIGPGKYNNSFQIALGLLNLDQALQTNFMRGTGTDSPNLVEFDYFWDSGFGATVWPLLVDAQSSFNYNGTNDFAIYTLTRADWYRVSMAYTSSNQTLTTTVTNLQQAAGLILVTPINTTFSDFRAGALALSSYSEAGQNLSYAGSVLAHGEVDNLTVRTPAPPVSNLTGTISSKVWQLQFLSRTNWTYVLERTRDFQSWAPVSAATNGTGRIITLQDTNGLAPDAQFYRVRAQRP